MNTRSSAKKDVYSKFASIDLEQPKTKARSTVSSDAEDDENIDDAQLERFPSPTFNIHIHVPYYDINNSKIFLPRIQPIINLHFDELARKLGNNRNIQNEKSFSKTFQNLLPKISPKFGVVKVHFMNNSEERNTEDADLNNVTSLLEEKNSPPRYSYDIRKKKVKSSNNVQNVTAEISEEIVNNNSNNVSSSSNNNNDNNSSNNNSSSINSSKSSTNNNIESKDDKSSVNSNCVLTSYELDKDIKLKKAVVMLTDICKSKNYKHFFENNSFCKNQNNENESSSYFKDKFENSCSDKQKYEEGMCSLKMEVESFTSETLSTEWNENNFDNPENYITNDNNLPSEEDENFKSNIEKICNEKDQNFTALVEGWSFSDILNRFQLKYSEKLGNCEVPFSSKVIKNRNSNDEMDNDSKLNHEINKVINKNEFIEEDFEKENNVDNKLHVVINKKEMHLNEEDCFDETVSDDTESYSFVQNETIKDEVGFLSEGSMNEFQNLTKEDFGPEFTSDSVNSEPDEGKITPEKEESSKGTVDMEIEHDVSSISSIAIQEIKFEVPETNKSSLLNVAHPKFHLELIKKEMQRRAISSTPINKGQKNLKSNKSEKSNKNSIESPPHRRESSSKKMKLSNGKPKTPEQNTVKSSQTGDFISLNPFGPTEFSVAALNNLSPSTSKAKDFKNNMLFGNRVNRFSSPDQLRIYQLKKEAAQKSLKH